MSAQYVTCSFCIKLIIIHVDSIQHVEIYSMYMYTILQIEYFWPVTLCLLIRVVSSRLYYGTMLDR